MGTVVTPHDQSRLLLRLDTALGKDVLIPTSLSGEDAMSEGFSYSLEVFSDVLHQIPPADIVGTPVTISLVLEDERLRKLHGYVSEIVALGRYYGGQRSGYRISVVSWLWFLGKQAGCRVFQDRKVEDVLKDVFAPLGSLARFDFKLTKSHPVHRYLVQYNETSLNFLYRLIRREGIAFYIEHGEAGHTVHFVDDGADLPVLEPDTLEVQAGAAGDRITAWSRLNRYVSGKYAQRSYNYKDPTKLQEVEIAAAGEAGGLPHAQSMEQYRYAETFLSKREGNTDVQWRLAQGTERYQLVSGSANYRHLEVGRIFTATQVPAGDWPDQDKPYALTRVGLYVSNRQGAPFSASFEAVPKGELVHAREGQAPLIGGLQTAVVTGPKGEEIHTDALGRIKVQFHWDREGGRDENTSCWLRVMQSFAGPGFGAHFTPRIGQEVVVAFENGNPDRPFVLGALYHPEHKPPYSGEPTQSGIKTRSTKQGGADNCNELRFDDKKGSEHFYVQAEKDLEVYVKNDEQRTIDRNLTTHVKKDESRTVDNNLELAVKNNENHKIGKKLKIHAGDEIELVVGGSSIKITGSKIQVGSAVVDIDGGKVEIN